MKNITSEKIDEVVNKAFLEQNENVLDDFINNYELYKRVFDENIKDKLENMPPDYVEKFISDFSGGFAGYKLAQDNCVKILSRSLKELLCDE